MFYFEFVTMNGPFKHQSGGWGGVNAWFEEFLTFKLKL
jgi:hypothetical protein